MARVDPELFGWSWDFVGDLAETVALIWPEPEMQDQSAVPSLSEIVSTLQGASRADVGAHLAPWLDALDATGRWALLKLVTGALRIGVSARLAKTALAEWSGMELNSIEEIWHGLAPPYPELFAWLEGSAPPPDIAELPTFCPLMLAQPLEEGDLGTLDPKDYLAEWKWDGIRVQLVSRGGQRRLYSRSGDDIGGAFPDILAAMSDDVTLDGELLVMRGGEVAPFNQLQQRLNRKSPDQKMLRDYPAGVRLYDILREGAEDLRPLPLRERRRRLEASHGMPCPNLDLSPMIPFADWEELKQLRAGARGRTWPRARNCVRQRAPLQPSQIRGGDAFPASTPHPMGQAVSRSRHACDAGRDDDLRRVSRAPGAVDGRQRRASPDRASRRRAVRRRSLRQARGPWRALSSKRRAGRRRQARHAAPSRRSRPAM